MKNGLDLLIEAFVEECEKEKKNINLIKNGLDYVIKRLKIMEQFG